MFVEQFLPAVNDAGQVMNTGHVQGDVLNQTGASAGSVQWDSGLRRPYIDKNGKVAVTVNTGRYTVEKGVRVPLKEHRTVQQLFNERGIFLPVWNATSLRKEDWLELDRQVLLAARYRLLLTEDIKKAGTYGGFNGMGKMILEHETMSDPGEAITDMDALTEGRNDGPRFQLEGLPLVITHSDFYYSERNLAVSRNSGMPLDSLSGEAAGQRIGESLEKTAIGNVTPTQFGGNSTLTGGYGRTSKVYGLINFPSRQTKTNLTTPSGSNASSTVSDVLAMIDTMVAQKFYGPWTIYHSNDWNQYLDNDYILTGGNVATQTLRQRLKNMTGIQDVKRLDMLFATQPTTNPLWTSSIVGTTGISQYRGPGGEYLYGGTNFSNANVNPFTMIMVQMTPNVVRWVDGMGITTVMWETIGGLRKNFKVMCIQVPQLRADFYGNCGILQAQTSGTNLQ